MEVATRPGLAGVWRAREAVRHAATSELLWGRAFPALVFDLIVVVRVRVLLRLLERPDALPTIAFAASLARETALGALAFFYVVLFVIRRPVVGARSRWSGLVVALAASFGLSVPLGPRTIDLQPPLLLVSAALVVAGLLWSAASLAYLGRCFGLLPEARGLVTGGPYRWVRHPLYLGEMTAAFGVVLASASIASLGAFAVVCALQVWRARLEEQALGRVFPEYLAYTRRTRRVLPGIY